MVCLGRANLVLNLRQRLRLALTVRPGFSSGRLLCLGFFWLCMTGITPDERVRLTSTAWGQLTSEQVVVIAAANSPESKEVADYYCDFRGISSDRIIEIEFPEGATLGRTAWEDSLRASIRTRLEAMDPEAKVTDVVLTHGTPLAVAAWEDDREIKLWEDYYSKAINDVINRINKAHAELARLAQTEPLTVPSPLDLPTIRAQFQERIEMVQRAIQAKPADARQADATALQNQVQAVAGLFPFISSLQQQLQNPPAGQSPNAMQQQLQYLRGRSEMLSQTIQYLEKMPATFERDATIVAMMEQGGGLLDSLTWLQRQLDLVQMNDSMASLDSELAIIFWNDYRRIGSVPNFLNPAFDGSPLRNTYRTLRVARIDGPTKDSAKALIDRTREAEAITSLEGNVYVDLRGIQSGDPILVRNENWLRAVGNQFNDVKGLTVTTEESAKLFQPGECPDTLVYLGWYSLGKYVPACTFKPGSIAYHLVPGDALRLRDAEQQGWCRGLIEAGATRVIGSVGEAVPVLLTIDEDAERTPMSLKVVVAELSDGMILFAVP